MLISFKTVRNLGLGVLLLIIITKSVFSYLMMNEASRHIEKIITIEQAKISRYIEVSELASEVKEQLVNFIDKRTDNISAIIFMLDEISKRIGIIKNLNTTAEETKVLSGMVFAISRFKAEVSDYERKIKAGLKGAGSFLETEQFLLDTSQDLIQLSRVVNQDVRQQIEVEHRIVLKTIAFFQKVLVLVLIFGIIAIFLVLFAMNRALAYPVKQLLFGAEAVARGDLDYRIKVSSGDEFTRLASSFNKMSRQLKESREDLLRSKETLTRVAEGIEEGIMLIDMDYRIIWTNKKVLNLVGVRESNGVGEFCYKITHHSDKPCQPPSDNCPISEVLDTGRPVTANHTHFDRDGNKMYVEVTVYPLKDEDGKINQFIHFSRDITKKIQLEKELRDNILRLEDSKVELQNKIKELEAFSKLAVYRELKMVELKEKIRELESKGGQNA